MQCLWVSVGICSHGSLLRVSPAVSPMPAGSVVSSAELWLLSLTPPDLFSFSPGLLEEGTKINSHFGDSVFLNQLSLKLPPAFVSMPWKGSQKTLPLHSDLNFGAYLNGSKFDEF